MDWEKQDILRATSFEQTQRKIAESLPYSELLFWRLNLLYPAKETQDVSEIIIRGHHLDYYQKIVKGQTPYEIAEVIMALEKGDDEFIDWYRPDVIGINPRDSYVMQTLLQSTFQRYLRLPDSTKVMITSEYDHICKSCKVGEHCRLQDPVIRNYEGIYIWQVYQEIKKQGLDNNCALYATPLEMPSYFGHTESVALELSTTKGILNQSLKHITYFGFRNFPTDWENAIEEMKSDPNTTISNQIYEWSPEEHKFILKK